MPERRDERAADDAALRFRQAREALAGGLAGLLGARIAPAPLDDPAHAARIWRELVQSRTDAQYHEWGLVSHVWPLSQVGPMTSAVHRLARNLGPRRAWLVAGDDVPVAAPLDAELALDNPVGFAALGGATLRLLDQELPAGLVLARLPLRLTATTTELWRLQVWGEPWLSATTRALRGESK